MELSKKSELTLGTASYVINTELAGEGSDSIRTQVVGADGAVAFETSQDISALKPIFQNSQEVFTRMETQHQNVIKELKHGRLDDSETPRPPATEFNALDQETDALEHAIALLGSGSFEKATASLRAVLETYPNCSEARELLEVAYKASSGTRLSIDLGEALRRGTEAFAAGRQRDAIEAWKQCLIEEPGNRLLQLLVMLATTWSHERRQHYANEVLAAGSASLSEGRPEEAQALLLIAQTVEGSQSGGAPLPTPAAPASEPSDLLSALEPDVPPVTPPAPPPAAPPPPPSVDDVGSNLESLVPDASELAVANDPIPMSAPEAPSFDETPPPLPEAPATAPPPPEISVVAPPPPEISVVYDTPEPDAHVPSPPIPTTST